MMNINTKSYIYLIILIPLLIYVGGSGYVDYKISVFAEASNRGPNPRRFPDDSRMVIIERFLQEKDVTKTKILVLGDSQSHGNKYSFDRIFSAYLEQISQLGLLNLSFPDARMIDHMKLIDLLKAKGFHFDFLIYNVNQGHTRTPNEFHLEEDMKNRIYYVELLKNPFTYAQVLDIEYMNRVETETLAFVQRPNYFSDLENKAYFELFETFIQKAQTVSNHLIFFVSPHAPSAVESNNYTMQELDIFTEKAFSVCDQLAIRCTYPQEIFDDQDFLDIVHFNQKGHQKMAEYLNQQIDKILNQ